MALFGSSVSRRIRKFDAKLQRIRYQSDAQARALKKFTAEQVREYILGKAAVDHDFGQPYRAVFELIPGTGGARGGLPTSTGVTSVR